MKRVIDDAHAVLTMDDHDTIQSIIDEYSDQALWGWAPAPGPARPPSSSSKSTSKELGLGEEDEECARKPTWRGHVPWAPVFMKELAALSRVL